MTSKPANLSSSPRAYVEGQLHAESTPMGTYHSFFKKGIQSITLLGIALCSNYLSNIPPAPNTTALGTKFNISLGRNKQFSSYGMWPTAQCGKGSDLVPKAEFSPLYSASVKPVPMAMIPILCVPHLDWNTSVTRTPYVFILE